MSIYSFYTTGVFGRRDKLALSLSLSTCLRCIPINIYAYAFYRVNYNILYSAVYSAHDYSAVYNDDNQSPVLICIGARLVGGLWRGGLVREEPGRALTQIPTASARARQRRHRDVVGPRVSLRGGSDPRRSGRRPGGAPAPRTRPRADSAPAAFRGTGRPHWASVTRPSSIASHSRAAFFRMSITP